MTIPSPAPGGGVFTGLDAYGRPSTVTYYGPPGSKAQIATFNVNSFYQEMDQNDHSLMIQRAINAAAAQGGGRIYCPSGFYNWKNGVIITSDNIEIIGDGWSTVFTVDSGWTSANPLIWYKQPTNAYRRGVRLADFSINGQNVAALTTVIELDGVRHCDVTHIEIHNCPGINLYMNGATAPYYGAYNTVRGCTFRDSYSGIGVKFSNSEWCSVTHCQFVLFNNAGSIGVSCNGGLNCNITGNQFDAVDTGVNLDFANYCNVTGNQFDEGNTQFIKIKAGQCNAIVGNTFNQRTGIGTNIITIDLFGSNNRRNLVAGNVAQSGPAWTNFIAEVNTGGAPTGFNTYVNNDTGGFAIVLINGVARSNTGWNPRGVLGPPAVPASTVAYTNAYGVDATVYVAGGTVTGISIGGTATGLTSGSFRVPASQTIAITYSVVPTWVWIGD